MTRFRPALPTILLALLAAAALPAQSRPRPRPMGIGPEVRVDTLSGDSKPSCPVIALAPDRSTEVVWSYYESSPYDVFGRHFSPVLAPTNNAQVEIGPPGGSVDLPLAIAVSSAPGGFQTVTARTLSTTGLEFFRRRLDASGSLASNLVPIGEAGTRWAWTGPGGTFYTGTYLGPQKILVVRQLLANGRPAGPRIPVNSRPVDAPALQLAAFGGNGDFVAVWTGLSVARGSSARQVIRGRLFRHGQPQGKDFDVNVTPGGLSGEFPILGGLALALNPATPGFTVAWTVEAGGLTGKVQGRTFDAQGRPTSPERLIFGDLSSFVSLACDDAGNVLAFWNDLLTPRSTVLGRLFHSDLTPISIPFEPWSGASGDFNGPLCAQAVWAGDSWRIAWTAETSKDGPRAVFVRRFTRGTPGS